MHPDAGMAEAMRPVLRHGRAFGVSTTMDEGAVVIRLVGELDAGCSERFERAIDEVSDEPRRIVADLHGLTFIDSAGIGMLFMLIGWSRERQVPALFRGARGQVARTLALAGADEVVSLG